MVSHLSHLVSDSDSDEDDHLRSVGQWQCDDVSLLQRLCVPGL